MILQFLIAMLAGRMQRHQQEVISYLREENCILKAQLGNRRLRFTDTECRRLATLAYPLVHKCLKQLVTLATPDTLMRWYRRLIAQKFDGSTHRRQLGRPLSSWMRRGQRQEPMELIRTLTLWLRGHPGITTRPP
jgi:hypothetical protein